MVKALPAISAELVKSLSEFHHRDLIQVPVIKKYTLSSVQQRCGLKAATLELDTGAYPNIEYVAGSRLNVYPANSELNVQSLLEYLNDDLTTIFQQVPKAAHDANPNQQQSQSSSVDANYNSPFWVKFIQQYNKRPGEALRLALTYFVDLTSYPSRELLRYIGDCCSQRTQRIKMDSITSTEDTWEKYVCQEARTMRSILEEFNSCKRRVSAKRLIIQELVPALQPRLYSISNIKSSKRFRAEIIVIQHKFTARQIALNFRTVKEHERELLAQQQETAPIGGIATPSPASTINLPLTAQAQTQRTHLSPAVPPSRPQSGSPIKPQQVIDQQRTISRSGIRSVRSMAMFTNSPITNQQVRRLPIYSGPLMSLYAASTTGIPSQIQSTITATKSQIQHAAVPMKSAKSEAPTFSEMSNKSRGSTMSPAQRTSLLSLPEMVGDVHKELAHLDESNSSGGARPTSEAASAVASSRTSAGPIKIRRFDGLCSNYLLNLQAGDQILCEFVENPRFTLKGNRERPIMMIAQDVGVIAFRAFWQQRQLEYDRAQVFYTMFKDLSPKKFGDMQLVCLTGHKCRIEELFKREISLAQTNKVLSCLSYINRQHLISLLNLAANRTKEQAQSALLNTHPLPIQSKDLLDLGQRIYKLLVESNGCLYTCCDPHMTQAIEILIVESISRHNKFNWTRDHIMQLLPRWKGRKEREDDSSVFQLENTFERAHIVQETYDSSI